MGRSLKEAMGELTPEDKQQMNAALLNFNAAKRNNGDVQAAFNQVWYTLKGIETKYNVTIFVPGVPETKMVDMIADKVAEKTGTAPATAPAAAPATAAVTGSSYYACNFPSIAHANGWLATQRNIKITNLLVNAGRVSLDIEQIRIEYQVKPNPNGYIYQITEELKHRIFAGTKLEKYRADWEKKHPGLKYVFCLRKKWAFSLFGSGVGFFRYVKEKFIVLYAQACK